MSPSDRQLILDNVTSARRSELLLLEAQGWIPVAERLPEDEQECWTFNPRQPFNAKRDYRVALHKYQANLDSELVSMWEAIDQGNNYPVVYYSSDFGFPDEGKDGTVYITHWRPLVRPSAPEWD